MGGMIANSSKSVYQGMFNKWRIHRAVLGKKEYLSSLEEDKEEEEEAVIAYVALNLGPMERDPGTVQNHLQAIGYFHRLRLGRNPLREMMRLQNLMKGAKREKGACRRKLPVTVEDLNVIYSKIDWSSSDSVTIWCTISIAWFFMLRMSEYLELPTRGDASVEAKARRPLTMDEIEPMIDGKRCEWSEDVNEISIYISGSKTDWLNQGMVRSRNLIPDDVEHHHLCPVRGLIKLWKLRPSKFHRNSDCTFATWKSGKRIQQDRVVSLLRMAVFAQGLNPAAFSLHSLRAGGATALYRATGNIELVARMGRWKTSSISAYLWESHEIMRGLGRLMAQGGHTLHKATKNLIALRPDRM